MTAFHFGFTRRKSVYLEQFLQKEVHALTDSVILQPWDTVYVWGDAQISPEQRKGAALVRVEDGLVRSVGLGVLFAQPVSWTFDYQGLHHWGHRTTDLELLVQSCGSDGPLLARASALRKRIVDEGFTKYNLPDEVLESPFLSKTRKRVLVVGQVADDAALRGITTPIKTNMGLLAAARERCPAAEILYRPHPDVAAGARDGHDDAWKTFADHRITEGSIVQLLPHVDEVHVLNSLAGFEALLRNVPVVCYANPFYAGWGLTTDAHPLGRRPAASLNQLIAAALIKYPKYRHPRTGQPLQVEEALDALAELRQQARSDSPISKFTHAVVARIARLADQLRLRRLDRLNRIHD